MLLQAYVRVVNELHIVGDGEERQFVELFICERHLEDKDIMHGAVFDEKSLAEKFSKVLSCISPTQGGLSVPKSMGYGVFLLQGKMPLPVVSVQLVLRSIPLQLPEG